MTDTQNDEPTQPEPVAAVPQENSPFLPPCPGPDPEITYPIQVMYCGECSMPVDLCNYSPDPAKCRQWLEKELPDLAEKLKLEDSASGSKGGAQKRGGKGVPRPGGASDEKAAILEIAHCPRGKKFDTVVIGFPSFGLHLKDVTRPLAQKFSCSVSVKPCPPGMGGKYMGMEMLLIQADVLDKLKKFIPETWPAISAKQIQDIGVVKR